MLKQGIVQETVADFNTVSQLPPLNTLPQWSRVNALDKARYPKPFLKDHLKKLPLSADGMERTSLTESGDSTSDNALELMADTMNSGLRIQHLERSIVFLQQQHHEVLHNLHDEIDNLKKENKELQLQLMLVHKVASPPGSSNPDQIRSKKGSASKSSSSRTISHPGSSSAVNISQKLTREATEEKMEELKMTFLEEEIKDLHKELKEEKKKNVQLNALLKRTQEQGLSEPSEASSSKAPSSRRSSGKATTASHRSQVASTSTAQTSEPLPFNATVDPVLVHPSAESSRPPTLQEFEIIVQHLAKVNDKQNHELNRLKADLRDVLYSHKWTPDAYLLAKAYILEDDAKEQAERGHLPRIPLRQHTRKLPEMAYIQRDQVTLPAMKQTLGNKAVERRKRTQILQKSRLLRREVLP